jgi:hypothetical protein
LGVVFVDVESVSGTIDASVERPRAGGGARSACLGPAALSSPTRGARSSGFSSCTKELLALRARLGRSPRPDDRDVDAHVQRRSETSGRSQAFVKLAVWCWRWQTWLAPTTAGDHGGRHPWDRRSIGRRTARFSSCAVACSPGGRSSCLAALGLTSEPHTAERRDDVARRDGKPGAG